MKTINVLHVSDVHFKADTVDQEQDRITSQLIDAAHSHAQEHGEPQICVFSGDLTQGGRNDEFEKGENWIKQLVKPWKDCALFVVPGNHEVSRPNKDDRPGKLQARGLRRSIYFSKELYEEWQSEIEKDLSLLKNFYRWHERIQMDKKLKVASDWSNSPFICNKKKTINGIKTVLIGLNTAVLSCDDDDQGKLVVDIGALNSRLKEIKSRDQLVILVGHHPIGKCSEEQWLAKWNDEELQNLLMQSSGPHLYLHGHLHKTAGATMNVSSGQNLTFFGAGAGYQARKQYPKRFAFYEINLAKQLIRPFTYKHDVADGEWNRITSGQASRPVRAVVPFIKGYDPEKLKEETNHLKEKIQDLTTKNSHLDAEYSQNRRVVGRFINRRHGNRMRHRYTSINYQCYVEPDGSQQITTIYKLTSVRPKEPIRFWKCSFTAEQPVPGVFSVNELDLKVEDLSNKASNFEVEYIVLDNSSHRKELCIFFIPEIKFGENRTIKRSYRWPGGMRHLLNGEEVPFIWDYDCDSGPDSPAEFRSDIEFHEEIGEVDCVNVSKSVPLLDPKKVKPRISSGTRWVWEMSDVSLSRCSLKLTFKII